MTKLTDTQRKLLSALERGPAQPDFLGIVLDTSTYTIKAVTRQLVRKGLVTITPPHGAVAMTQQGQQALDDWREHRDA